MQWIKEHKDSPFFLYYATTNIHHPFTPAERFVGTSEAGPYGDSIHELDWVVGEIMRTLDEEGLAGNTLLIFTSDNGGMLNHGGRELGRQDTISTASFLVSSSELGKAGIAFL